MTSVEMGYEWKITYESMASANAPGYTSREISVLLTQSQEEIVIETAISNLDNNAYARTVLEKLLTPYNNPTVTANTMFTNAFNIALPTGFFYPFIEFINNRAVKPTTYEAYYTSINNPWAKPYEELYWRLYDNNQLVVITDGITAVTAATVKGLFIKKPLPIIIESLGSNTIDEVSDPTDSELHPITHREIVNRAAKKAFAAVKDQVGYQIQNTEENQN